MVLENNAAKIERNDEAIWVAGVGDQWESHPNVASALTGVNDGASVIAFTRNPGIFPTFPRQLR